MAVPSMGEITNDRIMRFLERTRPESEGATLDEIAQRMGGAMVGADGEPIFQGLPEICAEWDVPYGKVIAWLMVDAERYGVYQRGLEAQAHMLVSQTIGIVDEKPGVTERGGYDPADIAWRKMRVEQRMRVAKHHAPKVYGEKVDVNHTIAPIFSITTTPMTERLVSDQPPELGLVDEDNAAEDAA